MRCADVTADDAARAEQAEVQPDAGAAGPAVEGEGHRPLAWIPVVDDVARDGQLGTGLVAPEGAVLVLLLAQHDAPGRRGVAILLRPTRRMCVCRDQVVRRLLLGLGGPAPDADASPPVSALESCVVDAS